MTLKSNKRTFNLKKSGEGKIAVVTGSGGRIGRSLSRALIRGGYEVRAISREKEFVKTMPAGVIPYVGDLADKKVLNEACKGADVMFHLAAVVSEYKSPVQELMDINVKGTTNVLEACRQHSIGDIIFTSSIDVYGRDRKGLITEDTELQPTDKYGYSKMLAEKEIIEYGDKIDYTILRIATVYGPGFEESYFKVFKAIKEGKAYIIGAGRNHLSMIHIEDVIDGLIMAYERKKGGKSIYNLSDGVKYTQEGLFDMIADMLKTARPTKHINPIVVSLVAKNRGLDSDELRFLMSNRVVDISRIEKELGYVPSVDIKDAGVDMVRHFLSR